MVDIRDKATKAVNPKAIDATRKQLGGAIGQLADKAEMSARVADLKDRAGALSVQLRSGAAQAGTVVQDKAGQAGHAVQGALTGPVRKAAVTAVKATLRRPGPALAAGAVTALAVVGIARRRRH